jgi:hypothetical protein
MDSRFSLKLSPILFLEVHFYSSLLRRPRASHLVHRATNNNKKTPRHSAVGQTETPTPSNPNPIKRKLPLNMSLKKSHTPRPIKRNPIIRMSMSYISKYSPTTLKHYLLLKVTHTMQPLVILLCSQKPNYDGTSKCSNTFLTSMFNMGILTSKEVTTPTMYGPFRNMKR